MVEKSETEKENKKRKDREDQETVETKEEKKRKKETTENFSGSLEGLVRVFKDRGKRRRQKDTGGKCTCI